MSNMILSDELMKIAAEKAAIMEANAFENEFVSITPHVFSQKYREKMDKLVMRERSSVVNIKSYRRLKWKYLLIAVLLMIIASMTAMAVEPVREKVYQIIETLFSDHTDISIEQMNEEIGQKGQNITSDNFDIRKVKEIPDGYDLEEDVFIQEIYCYFAIYNNLNDQSIQYQQMAIEHMDAWGITSSGDSAEKIAVNGDIGYLLTDDKQYHFVIYPWEGYVFTISGYNEVDELVEMLESIF